MAARRVAVVHASPNDAWPSPGMAATDSELEGTYGSLNARVVIYGHIHTSFIRSMTVMDVANCGSVSLSYDGDPRAAYALVDGSQIAIRRVQYDIDEEIRELHARRCPDAGWTAATLLAAVPQPLTAR